jgi:hypothetical protein
VKILYACERWHVVKADRCGGLNKEVNAKASTEGAGYLINPLRSEGQILQLRDKHEQHAAARSRDAILETVAPHSLDVLRKRRFVNDCGEAGKICGM